MKKKVLILALLALVVSALLAVGASAYEMGDANLDGAVNTRDAVLIKQYVAEMISLTEEQKYYADAFDDGTGAVTVRDAVLILQHVAEMDVVLDARTTFTFETNGGSAIAPVKEKKGRAVAAPEAPSKTGYTFGGWYADAALAQAYTFTTMPATDTTLYAKWNVNSYTITFETGDGSAVAPITQNYNTAVNVPEPPTKAGFNFGGWYADAAMTRVYLFDKMPAEDTTVYAKWIPVDTYTVTFCDEDGTVFQTVTVKKGDSATPPANPEKNGFRFIGWEGEYTNITGNTIIKAKYIRRVTVIFLDADRAILDIQTVDLGQSATAPEVPSRSGHRFGGWDASFENVEEDVTVMAQYVRLYTVIFLDYNGTVLKKETVEAGANATPPTDPSLVGYHFAGWQGTYTNISADTTLIATYETNTYTVRFKLPDGTLLARYYCENCETYRREAELVADNCPICGAHVVSVTEQTVPYGFSAVEPDYPQVWIQGEKTSAKAYAFTRWSCDIGKITADVDVVAVYETACTVPVLSVEYEGSSTSLYLYAPTDLSIFGLELSVSYPSQNVVTLDRVTCSGLFNARPEQYVVNNNTGNFTYVWNSLNANGEHLTAFVRVVALEFSAVANADSIFVDDCHLVTENEAGAVVKLIPAIIYH